MKARKITFSSFLLVGVTVGLATHTFYWFSVACLAAACVDLLPIWPRRIELKMYLSPYEHSVARQHLGLDKCCWVTAGSTISIYAPRAWKLYGCRRFTISLLDTPREDMDVTIKKNSATIRLNPKRSPEHWLDYMDREDVVRWKVDPNGLGSHEVYLNVDPKWLPIRPERLASTKVYGLHATGNRMIRLNFMRYTALYEFKPEQMRIVLEPRLEHVFLINRMDWHHSTHPTRQMLLVAPSLDAIRRISVGPVADLISVAHNHPGVLCANCERPHGLKSEIATCYCGNYDPNPPK